MQILEAALAFAITMLVLSLICSSFVEIIHRVLAMREDGFKLMLDGMYDKMLKQYVEPRLKADLATTQPQLAGDALDQRVATDLDQLKTSFLNAMKENRAPVTIKLPLPLSLLPKLWYGDQVTGLKPEEFMERLASVKVGDYIKAANDAANNAGAAAAGAVDAVLKDVAQKFDNFGKEASAYFAGRARLLSVCVAIALAFAIRVDAIELFNTYLRDPNARNKVIEQSQAATAQYKAMTEAANAVQAAGGQDAKQQVDALQQNFKAAIDNTRSTVAQYSDLGLPIGWTKENATLDPRAKTCTSVDGRRTWMISEDKQCNVAAKETLGTVGIWAVLKLIGSLVLGGILIGLGAPFWSDAVTGLTNIREIARDVSGAGSSTQPQQGAPAPAANNQPPAQPAPSNPDRPQPVTPVGNFTIAQVAREAATPPPAAPLVQRRPNQTST